MDMEQELFGRRLTYPDSDASKRLARLVGLDEFKIQLTKALGILVNPSGVRRWSEKFHNGTPSLIGYVERRPPLIILAGEVGTGKTELAETIGDAVARQEGISVTLLPLSLSTRGSGRVGEMTQLLTAAFKETYDSARRLRGNDSKSKGAIVLLVDEGDAIVQSREGAQMHHEDRAGVNAFIRGVDTLARDNLPAAVILCTNRLKSIDPAVHRRAADVLEFVRPNDKQRRLVIEKPLKEVGFTDEEIAEVVELTGSSNNGKLGFTYSDLTQRLLPTLVLDAYPDSAVEHKRAIAIIRAMAPTPNFIE